MKVMALTYNRTLKIKSGEKILLNKMIQIFIYIFTFHFNLSAITSNDDTNSIKRNFYLNA